MLGIASNSARSATVRNLGAILPFLLLLTLLCFCGPCGGVARRALSPDTYDLRAKLGFSIRCEPATSELEGPSENHMAWVNLKNITKLDDHRTEDTFDLVSVFSDFNCGFLDIAYMSPGMRDRCSVTFRVKSVRECSSGGALGQSTCTWNSTAWNVTFDTASGEAEETLEPNSQWTQQYSALEVGPGQQLSANPIKLFQGNVSMHELPWYYNEGTFLQLTNSRPVGQVLVLRGLDIVGEVHITNNGGYSFDLLCPGTDKSNILSVVLVRQSIQCLREDGQC
eukprot:Nk52_evm42s210 gene=Nk52_evmTU42s210